MSIRQEYGQMDTLGLLNPVENHGTNGYPSYTINCTLLSQNKPTATLWNQTQHFTPTYFVLTKIFIRTPLPTYCK